MKNQSEAYEPEVVEAEEDREDTSRDNLPALVPNSLAELAVLRGKGLEIIDARIEVLETLRRAAIRSTHPEDWTLFKTKDQLGGQVTAYLADSGCDRVRDLYGIEVFDVGQPQKILGSNPREFHYIVSGSGRCKITRQVVESIEGGRSSSDDFCKGKQGAELELAVRKAARANLDGGITRELAGLKSVPLQELEDAWKGTNKRASNCRKGRGFGSRAERQGARVDNGAPRDLETPRCEICTKLTRFIPAGRTKPSADYPNGRDYDAFYSCPDPDHKWAITVEELRRELKRAQGKPDKPEQMKEAKEEQRDRDPGEEG